MSLTVSLFIPPYEVGKTFSKANNTKLIWLKRTFVFTNVGLKPTAGWPPFYAQKLWHINEAFTPKVNSQKYVEKLFQP